MIHNYAQPVEAPGDKASDSSTVEVDFQTIDINQMTALSPRAIGAVVVKSDEKDQIQVMAKRVDCPDSGEVRLKAKGIHYSWQSIRDLMSSQRRITLSMRTREEEQIHLRMTSRAEAHQQRIYEALGITSDSIGNRRMSIENAKTKSVVPTGG